MRLDINHVRQQIENLKLVCPEAWADDDEKLLEDMLSAETEIDEFLLIVEARRQDAEAMAGAVGTQIAQLELRQDRYEKREKAMRDLTFKIMQSAAIKKRELSIATISIRNGTPKLIITDENLIPDILCTFTRTPNRARLKDMLKAGQHVQGAELSNAEPCLSIRVK